MFRMPFNEFRAESMEIFSNLHPVETVLEFETGSCYREQELLGFQVLEASLNFRLRTSESEGPNLKTKFMCAFQEEAFISLQNLANMQILISKELSLGAPRTSMFE